MAKDFFKDKKGKARDRTAGKRGVPKPDAILICSEGTETEPHYFQGLADYINEKCGDNITNKPILIPQGIGRQTTTLVNETDKIVARSKKMYKQVWVVFDEDGDTHFDEAIKTAKQRGYQVAWSNKSFEYWMFLHFRYSDAALQQGDWTRKIDEIFRRNGINPNGYDKNDPKIFEIVTANGGLKKAVSNAKKVEVEKEYSDGMLPSRCNPCTKVYKLIEELAPYIPELLE